MDELLGEFLTETDEGLDQLDVELVRFEQDPNNAEMLNTIFRLVHTVKGTCGFLGLARLAKLAHAAETLMGQYRDGAPVTVDGVSVILKSIDRIKQILEGLERDGAEPQGSDADLIGRLQALAISADPTLAPAHLPNVHEDDRGLPPVQAQLDELERAWRETPGPELELPEPLAPDDAAAGANGRESQARAQTVRVSVDTLEHLMTTVSELVLTRNQLLDIVRRTGESEFKSPLQRLSNVTAELQEGIMKARMQPIANAWQKLPRLVRELSLELDKKIELDMAGGDTELDRQVLEMIKDPLTHMIRNSADHGLESPAERMRAGKPETGRIKLSAYQQGGYIVIEVADDGRGLDAQKIRAKAHENGLATPRRARPVERQRHFQIHFSPWLLDRERGERCLWPRRRHGRGAQQYRADRRNGRAQIDLARRHHLRHQDSADACHHGGADRRSRGPSLRHPAIQRGRAGARRQCIGSPGRGDQRHGRAAAARQALAAARPRPAAEARRRGQHARSHRQ